ncbi:MAG: hypothetical protein ACQESR_06235 [Planctomycetota bacterium]
MDLSLATSWTGASPEIIFQAVGFCGGRSYPTPAVLPPVGFTAEKVICNQNNIGTHHSNIRMAWHLLGQLNIDDAVRQLEREHALWAEWLSYNAVPEPDWSYFTLNRAIETRQSLAQFRQLDTPLAETVKAARAFATSREEYEQALKLARRRTEENWPQVPELRVGEHMGYSPYTFLHLRHPNYYPTKAERNAARRQLPYLARRRFVHQRTDNRTSLAVTCVRRPAYYAVFNAGPGRGGHRYGLGLLWHPRAGTFLQQQTRRVPEPGWGTRAGDAKLFESAPMTPEYRMDGQVFDVRPGNREIEGHNLAVRYALGEAGHKVVMFFDDRIEVRVECSGTFQEEVPVLARPDDEFADADRCVTVTRNDVVLEITFDDASDIQPARRENCHFICVSARDNLQYTIRFSDTRETTD